MKKYRSSYHSPIQSNFTTNINWFTSLAATVASFSSPGSSSFKGTALLDFVATAHLFIKLIDEYQQYMYSQETAHTFLPISSKDKKIQSLLCQVCFSPNGVINKLQWSLGKILNLKTFCVFNHEKWECKNWLPGISTTTTKKERIPKIFFPVTTPDPKR